MLNLKALCKLFGIGKLTVSSANWLNVIGYNVSLKNNVPVIEVADLEEDYNIWN